MEGASGADNLAEVDFRKLADPDQIEQAQTPPRRGWRRSCGRG